MYFAEESANELYNNISFEVLGLFQINLKNELNFEVNILVKRINIVQEAKMRSFHKV
ncbi:MAG: hypothetical protein ACJAYY_000658 [Paraglaciecola sp.]